MSHASASASAAEGLWRAVMAGPGCSLTEAFANLERSSHVACVLRHPTRALLSARVNLTPLEGEGYWELTRIRDDIYVILSNFAYRDPRLEIVPGDGLVQFNFKLSGDLTYAISRPGPLRFNRPSLHVWHQPRGIDMRETTAPRAHERTVSISVTPQFLRESFLSDTSDVPAKLRAFVQPVTSDIGFCQVPLTAAMLDLTTRLLNNPYEGALGLTYREALILEILCIAVGHFCSLRDAPAEEYSERELKCLQAARELLMRQFSPVPTLARIGERVGLGEKALTRGFKAVYGETIFDFSLRCRMQHALALLRDRRWPVDRVSEAAGYAHPTSFATAFRRHFGMRPIDVKPLKSQAHQGSAGQAGSPRKLNPRRR